MQHVCIAANKRGLRAQRPHTMNENMRTQRVQHKLCRAGSLHKATIFFWIYSFTIDHTHAVGHPHAPPSCLLLPTPTAPVPPNAPTPVPTSSSSRAAGSLGPTGSSGAPRSLAQPPPSAHAPQQHHHRCSHPTLPPLATPPRAPPPLAPPAPFAAAPSGARLIVTNPNTTSAAPAACGGQ